MHCPGIAKLLYLGCHKLHPVYPYYLYAELETNPMPKAEFTLCVQSCDPEESYLSPNNNGIQVQQAAEL